ncbi:hypothetical protein VYA_10900 [Vibrio alfacsensis]|nr:hypothetical protein VYA_10900 [Vibrio alfacsensis]
MEELDWSRLIPMSVSALAACVSVFYARKARKAQINQVEHKFEIEQLNELIEKLKIANAIETHPHDYDDDTFVNGRNLDDVPSKIAKLMQNSLISKALVKTEWELPITNLQSKIDQLCAVRKKLL